MKECMLDFLLEDGKKYFTCKNCPIQKYNCCKMSIENETELLSRLQIDIDKLSILKEKVLDKIYDK